MLLFPENLQNSDLSSDARRCILSLKNRLPDTYTGIDQINISGVAGDNHFAIINSSGLILLRFWDNIDISNEMIQGMLKINYTQAHNSFYSRLMSHIVLKNKNGKILFPFKIIYVFLNNDDIPQIFEKEIQAFFYDNCRGKKWISDLRKNTEDEIASLLNKSQLEYALPEGGLQEDTIDVLINRIAPWCTIPKLPGNYPELYKTTGLDDNKFSILNTDSIVEILRLDPEQVDTVNAITKGHQLILACAGSGKSVLLIARCFKLASLDKEKKYLLTCYNRNLNDYYNWQIDEAGFKERNVDCYTFHALCKRLLQENNLPLPSISPDYYDELFTKAYAALLSGKIKNRYYGIFIDEVQIFDPKWYRFCYQLLENSDNDEHIFVICGDLTQDMKKNVKRGLAPWQGDGLPVFKGRTIHIEKNYRNSIEINSFINEYALIAKNFMSNISNAASEDTFLRGKAFKHGFEPHLITFDTLSSKDEAQAILKAINKMHDEQLIGYTDIAVLIYNQSSSVPQDGWINRYRPKADLESLLDSNHIRYVELSWNNGYNHTNYQARNGVSIITYEGVLGIDYRGVIVAGLRTIGERAGINFYDKESIQDKSEDERNEYTLGFNALYLACTRAKESLAVVAPNRNNYRSIYTEAIFTAYKNYVSKRVAEVR